LVLRRVRLLDVVQLAGRPVDVEFPLIGQHDANPPVVAARAVTGGLVAVGQEHLAFDLVLQQRSGERSRNGLGIPAGLERQPQLALGYVREVPPNPDRE